MSGEMRTSFSYCASNSRTNGIAMSALPVQAQPRQAHMRLGIGAAEHGLDHVGHAMRGPFNGPGEPLEAVPYILQEAAERLGLLREDRAAEQERHHADEGNGDRRRRDENAADQQPPSQHQKKKPPHTPFRSVIGAESGSRAAKLQCGLTTRDHMPSLPPQFYAAGR